MRRILLPLCGLLTLACVSGCAVLPPSIQKMTTGTTTASGSSLVWSVVDMNMTQWKTYRDPQSLYRVSYPPTYTVQRTSTGVTLTGPEGTVQLAYLPSTNLAETLGTYFARGVNIAQRGKFQVNLRFVETAAVILVASSDDALRHERIYLYAGAKDIVRKKGKQYPMIVGKASGTLPPEALHAPTKSLDSLLSIPEQILSTVDFLETGSSSSA